jgi:hypothetical protein
MDWPLPTSVLYLIGAFGLGLLVFWLARKKGGG